MQAGCLTPLPGAFVSHGECYACVASLPTPSPCNRPDRLGLLWVGLTSHRTHWCLQLVGHQCPAGCPTGAAVRPPEFEVPPFCQLTPGVHLFALLCDRATILLDPGGTCTCSPLCSCRCCLPPDVTRSAPTSPCLRGCINLSGLYPPSERRI